MPTVAFPLALAFSSILGLNLNLRSFLPVEYDNFKVYSLSSFTPPIYYAHQDRNISLW